MSADNWTICPRCKRVEQVRIDAIEKQARESYGNVPADQYEELMARARELAKKPMEHEFREDYEIGMGSDGEFSVGYAGHCAKCDYGFSFKHNEFDEKVNAPIPAAAPERRRKR